MKQFALALFGLAQLMALSSASSPTPRSGRELFDRLPAAQTAAARAAPTPYPDNPLTRFLLRQELERPRQAEANAADASLWAQIGDAHDHQQRLLDVIDEAESYEARNEGNSGQNKVRSTEFSLLRIRCDLHVKCNV